MQITAINEFHKENSEPLDLAIFDLICSTSDICRLESNLTSECINQIKVAIKTLSSIVSKKNNVFKLQINEMTVN